MGTVDGAGVVADFQALLTVIEGDRQGESFALVALPDRPVRLGRNPSHAVFINEASVSRDHAVITYADGAFSLTDLNSSNGTVVNGGKITAHVLADGDVVVLGRTKLRFTRVAPSPAYPSGPVAAAAPVKPADRPADAAPRRPSASPAFDETWAVETGRFKAPASEVHVDDQEDVLELAIDLDSLEFGEHGVDLAHRLEKERDKLRTIYKVGQAIGTVRNIDELLDSIMDAVFEVVPQADRGAVMLRGGDGALTTKAVRVRQGGALSRAEKLLVSRTVVDMALNEGKAVLCSDAIHDDRFRAQMSIVNLEIRSMMCVPLVHAEERLGVIHLDTMRQGCKFTQDDLSLLQGVARQAAMAIKIAQLLSAIEAETSRRTSLQRFLSPTLVEQVMKSEVDLKLGGARKRGTIFFSDIIGFTRMSSHLAPEEVVARLNRYFQIMVGIIFDYEGMVNKFGGDSIMAIWGLAQTNSNVHAARCAVEAAVRMQAAVFDFNYSLAAEGYDGIWMGIGLNTGSFVAGNIGSERQMEFTVIGDEVNLAARIEAKAPREMVYISASTFEEVREFVSAVKMPPTRMKNIDHPVTMYSVRACLPIRTADTDTPFHKLYTCIMVEASTEGDVQRGIMAQALVGKDTTVLSLHLASKLKTGAVVRVQPRLPELPGCEPMVAKVSRSIELQGAHGAYFDVVVEVVEHSSTLKQLLDRQVLVSSIDPDSIPRG